MKNIKYFLAIAGLICGTIVWVNAQDKVSKATPAQIAKDNAEIKKAKDYKFLKQSPTGLLYSITDHDGKGNNKTKPTKYTKVKIKYSIHTIDHKVHIRDHGTKPPVEMPLDKLPYGIQEAIKLMDIGQNCLFYFPAKLAKHKYGSVGNGRALAGFVELHGCL